MKSFFRRLGIDSLGWVVMAAVASLPSCRSAQAAVSRAQLSTADVRITVAAERSAPRLVSLQEAGGRKWINRQPENLPNRVEIGGTAVSINWRLDSKRSKADSKRVVFVYDCATPHLRLFSEWKARAGFGPIEHSIRIENLGGEEIWLPMVDSLAMDWRVTSWALNHFYVEKGADTPSAIGTHVVPIAQEYKWTGRSSSYATPVTDKDREIIPIEMVYRTDAEDGWYAGIEFSGRTRIHLERSAARLMSVMGLDPEPGPYRTLVPKGEAFETPTVFLGAFYGGPDGAGNQIRPWVRTVLGNPHAWSDPHYPVMVNNSWGSGMQVDEQTALRMIADSKELGLEMFHLDAGWFRAVADWYPDPKKFPHGLAPIAEEAHRQGLRFGLWVDWSQAGLSEQPGALNVHDPKVRDWLVKDVSPDWKPEQFKGQTIDLGDPEAEHYAAGEVKRIVEQYHLDMLEHDGYLVAKGCTRDDHPHAPPQQSTMHVVHDWGSDFVIASNSTDVDDHAVRAYYRIYEQLRREHPELLLEICNDGGRMVDFGSAAHGDYFSITDTYDPLSNRRAFYDASYVLPPAMLESYVEKWPTPRPENFLYMLRSGMMGWTSIMLDTTAWSKDQHEAARRAINLYKDSLRSLIRDAELYHISPRPDGEHWDGMEYWDRARGKGVVFAFRGKGGEPEHRFVLRGLETTARYTLHFEDGSSADMELSGHELMETGLPLHLSVPFSSELVFLNKP